MKYNHIKIFIRKYYSTLVHFISKPMLKNNNFILLANNNIKSLSTLKTINKNTNDDFLQQTHIRVSSHITMKALNKNLPRYKNHAVDLKKQLNEYIGPEINSIIWARVIMKEYEEKYGL